MAGNKNKLLTGTIIVIHSEKEVSVVKITGNIKENIQKSSEVAHLDGTFVGGGGRGVSTTLLHAMSKLYGGRGHIHRNRYGIPYSHLNNILHLHLKMKY